MNNTKYILKLIKEFRRYQQVASCDPSVLLPASLVGCVSEDDAMHAIDAGVEALPAHRVTHIARIVFSAKPIETTLKLDPRR